eukprot:5515931-Pleurochrysis_carterae.AAC.4
MRVEAAHEAARRLWLLADALRVRFCSACGGRGAQRFLYRSEVALVGDLISGIYARVTKSGLSLMDLLYLRTVQRWVAHSRYRGPAQHFCRSTHFKRRWRICPETVFSEAVKSSVGPLRAHEPSGALVLGHAAAAPVFFRPVGRGVHLISIGIL